LGGKTKNKSQPIESSDDKRVMTAFALACTWCIVSTDFT